MGDAIAGDVLLIRFTRHPYYLAIGAIPLRWSSAYTDAGVCVKHGLIETGSAASSPPTAVAEEVHA
jgi:hypothetical protein